MTDLIALYQVNARKYAELAKALSKTAFQVAMARLAIFALIIFCIYRLFTSPGLLYILAIVVLVAAFLWLVKKSATITSQKALANKRVFINENEIDCLKGENGFNNGDDLQTGESYFADLDVFGHRSVFHLLNRTSTTHGTASLAEQLKQPFTDVQVISNHQTAVQVLAPQQEARELIIAKSMLHSGEAINFLAIEEWLFQTPVLLKNNYIRFARVVLPIINMIIIVLSIYWDRYQLLSLCALVSWIHVGYFAKYTNQQHQLIGKREEALKQYAGVLNEFSKVQAGNSTLIQNIQNDCLEAHIQINKLSGLANMLDQRMNLLVNIFLNSFFLYELHCVLNLEKWKEQNRNALGKWIKAVGHIETLTSFATFAFNHPTYTYPTFNTGRLTMEGSGMAHPLMFQDTSVTNDLSFGERGKLLLITGSNMSGKTTFLRTVGVNVLLAQCGAPVCATHFNFSPFRIYSSIRISDSLQENTSYFMAELKRLHEIRNSIADQAPSLVLIDEILRGTNSEDKFYGSQQFMLQLIRFNALTLFATHDLKLSELENQHPGIIANFCFESTIVHDELFFDYKIRRGVAQNKNASFLMKKMDII